MSRTTRVGLVSLVAIAVGGMFIHASQDKTPTAQAEIMVVRRDDGKKTGTGFQEDYVATHAHLITSQLIAEVAAKQGNLNQLASMKDKDVVAEILKAVKVERPNNANNSSILKVSVSHLHKKDAVMVLEAVLAAYQQHIKDVFADLTDGLIKSITQTSTELSDKIKSADEELKKFYMDSPHLIFKSSTPTVTKATLTLTTEQLAKANVEHGDLEVRIQVLSEAAKTPDTAEAVKIKAREWGKNLGLEPRESTVESYLASMRLDLLIVSKRQEQLKLANTEMNRDMRELLASETKQYQLQDARARAVTQYAEVQKLISNANFRSIDTGFRIVVVTKPHVVE